MVADLRQRREILEETLHNFELISDHVFVSMKSSKLEEAAYNLAAKYSKY
jgi:hypothetical protein